MIDVLVYAYLSAPVIFAIAMFVFGVTRAPDRIQLASVCLAACALSYGAIAFSLVSSESPKPAVGVALGLYAAVVYFSLCALAVYTKAWAWRVAVGAFALHLLAGLLGSVKVFEMTWQARGLLLAYLAIGAIGLWATLHKGTRNAVRPGHQVEA